MTTDHHADQPRRGLPTGLLVLGGVVAVAIALGAGTLVLRGDGSAGPDLVAGATLYQAHCAICHGDTGEGGTGPALSGAVSAAFPEIGDQIDLVTGGGRAMPAFTPRLSAEEIENVVAFTRAGL